MRANERRLRALLGMMSEVACIVSPDGVFRYVGDASLGTLGLEPEALYGTPLADLAHPLDRDVVAGALRDAAASPPGASGTLTCRLLRADGRWRTVLMTIANRQDDPDVGGLALVLRDVSARIDAEHRLKESEALHRTLAEFAPVGIFRTDADGRIVFANARLRDLLRVEVPEPSPHTWIMAVHPDDRDRLESECRRKLESGQTMLVDFRILGSDGITRWALCQTTPLSDMAGNRQGIIGTITDMTEYVRTVEALLVAEARTNAIVDMAADAIMTIDEAGTIQSFNRAAEEMFGIAAADILWQNVDRLIPAADRTQHGDRLAAYVSGRTTRVVGRARDILALRGDGTEFPIELSVSAIETSGRRLYTGIIRDITRRKEIERELIDAKEAAVAADRAKSAFLAAMSHELRTPLNAIIGFAQLIELRLVDTNDVDRLVEYGGSIRRSGEHLLGIIEDILDISKIEAGNLTLNERVVDVADVIANSLTLVALQAEQGGITITTDLPPDPPAVMADELRLRQILVNLLSNAVKFSNTGGRVWVGARRGADGGLELTVADNGVGMDEASIPLALAPFAQVDQSFSRRYEGTGLGLPLTKRLVDMHGGTLDIASAVGKGTTVRVHFPPGRVLDARRGS